MTNKILATLGISACAAACAASVALPAIFGASVLGAGGVFAWASGLSLEVIICLLAALGIAAVAFYRGRQKAQTQSCASDGSCGCKATKVIPLERT